MQTLITEAEVRDGIARLATRIDRHYAGQPLTLVAILNGSVVFLADLLRALTIPVQVETLRASSYRGETQTPGSLWVDPRAQPAVAGRHVLLIDDIFDTGQTLERIREAARSWGSLSVRSAVLLWKRSRSRPGAAPDDFVFEIPDRFVVGFGLDYNGDYRQLPRIAVLDSPPAASPSGEPTPAESRSVSDKK